MMISRVMRLTLLLGVLGLPGCATTGSGNASAAGPTRPADEISQQAEAAYEQQDWAAAEAYYTELVNVVPQESEAWFRLGNCYTRNGKPESAVAAYKEALVRDPELSKAWYNMGLVQLRQSVNSFQQMSQYAEAGSKQRQVGESVYRAILEILSRDYTSE